MRASVFILALAVATFASHPAWAFSKGQFSAGAQAQAAAMIDPCAVSNSPHERSSRRAAGFSCSMLARELASAPGDRDLLERCNNAAFALNGRSCDRANGKTRARGTKHYAALAARFDGEAEAIWAS